MFINKVVQWPYKYTYVVLCVKRDWFYVIFRKKQKNKHLHILHSLVSLLHAVSPYICSMYAFLTTFFRRMSDHINASFYSLCASWWCSFVQRIDPVFRRSVGRDMHIFNSVTGITVQQKVRFLLATCLLLSLTLTLVPFCRLLFADEYLFFRLSILKVLEYIIDTFQHFFKDIASIACAVQPSKCPVHVDWMDLI